jgi:hypothetical protein
MLPVLKIEGKCDPSIVDSVGLDNLIQFHIWSMENLERLWFETVEEKGYHEHTS